MNPDYPASVVAPRDLAFGKSRLGELARAAVHILNTTSSPVSSAPVAVEALAYHPPPVSAVVPPVVAAPSPGVASSILPTSEEVSRLNRTLQELLHRVEDRPSAPPTVVNIHTHLAPPVGPALHGDGGEVDMAAVGGAVLAVLVVLLVVCGLVLRRWYPDQWTGVKRRVRGVLKLLALPFLLHTTPPGGPHPPVWYIKRGWSIKCFLG
jgi:hypothetical protein